MGEVVYSSPWTRRYAVHAASEARHWHHWGVAFEISNQFLNSACPEVFVNQIHNGKNNWCYECYQHPCNSNIWPQHFKDSLQFPPCSLENSHVFFLYLIYFIEMVLGVLTRHAWLILWYEMLVVWEFLSYFLILFGFNALFLLYFELFHIQFPIKLLR